MKKFLSRVIALVLSMAVIISIPVQASSTPSSWAKDEVDEAIDADLVISSVKRDYQADITREQFCEMVVRAYEKISGEEAEAGSVSFTDTSNAEILKAANLGIVSGYGGGKFGPDDLITREQIAAMLVRMIDKAVSYANVNVYNSNKFSDSDSISDWALPAVNFAYDKEIMQGMDDNKIAPLDNTTCEQAILLVYRTVKKYGIGELSVNNPYFLVNNEEEATFTIEFFNDAEEIGLYKNGNVKVAEMHDDGKNGDYAAGDNIYSCTTSINFESEGVDEYFAKVDDIYSNYVSLFAFNKPTEQSAERTKTAQIEICAELEKLESKYADQSGIVQQEQLTALRSEMNDYISSKSADGTIAVYEVNYDNVYIKFSTGLSEIYATNLGDTDSNGSSVNLNIRTYQPCKTGMENEGSNYLYLIDDGAYSISRTFDNCSYSSSSDYDDDEVTLDQVKSLGANQIVLWHGHGYYGNIVKSCLVLGEKFDWNAWWFDLSYFSDCVHDRILNRGDDDVCISSKFIEYYCGDLSNSMFYLATCSSGKSSNLAQAFLNKGAAAVVANTETIKRTYNVSMLCAVVDYMQNINPSTNNYYTLQEALDLAKDDIGSSDATGNFNGVGSTPIIFGGSTAYNYRFGQAAYGDYEYYGDATLLDNGNIELTPLETWKSGSAWYKNPFNTEDGFEIRFSYWAGGGRDDSYGGADGIVCMLADKTGIGRNGEYLGFVGGDNWGIEIDSYPCNTDDPEEKHIALIHKTVSNHIASYLTDKTDDSQWHNIRIVYRSSNIQTFLDDDLILSYSGIDLPDRCYIGFSGSTGSGLNRHIIKNISVVD